MKKRGFINLFVLLVVAIVGLGIASTKGILKPNVLGWTSILADRGSDSSPDGENPAPRPTPQTQETRTFREEKRNETSPTEKLNVQVTRLGPLVKFEAKNEEATQEAEKEQAENENEDEQALHEANNALETKDIEVATNDSGLIVRQGETEAETHLPISVNTVTHELTVTTPAGTKTVTVLPDAAVNNLLNQGILTNVESQPATAGASPTNKVTIVEFNNEPAFEVHGTVEKKLFGVIPFGQGKKVFVSTQTGGVLSQSEDLLGQLLGLFSF